MPHVQITSSTGKTRFKYTICTPASAEAKSINRKLPTLLFIHPVSIAEHIFHSQFCDPQLRRFNLVSFDLRGGHGGTTGDKVPSHYGQTEAAEDTMKLMDALDLPPCHLVGMSTGTVIATQLAVSYPDRVLSLFLVSHLCLKIPPEVAEGHQEVYDLWASAFPDASTVLTDTLYEAGFGNSQYMFSNPQLSPLVSAMTRITYPVAMKRWDFKHLDEFRTMNLDFYLNRWSQSRSSLARIAGPVKLVYGSDDVAYPESYSKMFLRQLRHAGVDASLSVIPDAPHYMAPDFGNELNPILHDFIVEAVSLDLSSAPIPSHVMSPWEGALRHVGWDPEDSLSEDDLIIHAHRIHSTPHSARNSLDCSSCL
ncbi:hypothetical protein GYMLUDRAFT_188693 [Collybiopsis luxurians FD-317 M1]|nr:hypothetical protein GYMLUDRAFT_188693 [Collybiopsis luxurians FD-317 M1]